MKHRGAGTFGLRIAVSLHRIPKPDSKPPERPPRRTADARQSAALIVPSAGKIVRSAPAAKETGPCRPAGTIAAGPPLVGTNDAGVRRDAKELARDDDCDRRT